MGAESTVTKKLRRDQRGEGDRQYASVKGSAANLGLNPYCIMAAMGTVEKCLYCLELRLLHLFHGPFLLASEGYL